MSTSSGTRSAGSGSWLLNRLGRVGVKKLTDRLRHSLSFIPGLYVVFATVLVQLTLWLDRRWDDPWLPEVLLTTVGAARAVLGAIAGGLITSITLLLSMMLITIQLASGQFSPRSLRDWLGDRLLQHTVGLTLGTTIFSLWALRAARTLGEDSGAVEVSPHLTTLLALVFAVIALFGVVASVDHITHSLRIGSVSRRIANDTIAAARLEHELHADRPPVRGPTSDDTDLDVSDEAVPIETPVPGWVQQIDDEAILDALPDDSTAWVTATLGGFLPAGSPLMWVEHDGELDDATVDRLRAAFATGDTRTLQQDVSFGLAQLTDIAVRALSPGVNDPGTAIDITVQLGNVMLVIWEQPTKPTRQTRDGRTLLMPRPSHARHLEQAFGPIRRYGTADPQVLGTMLHVLDHLRAEIRRRDLVGPIEPIETMARAIADGAERSTWSDTERHEVERLVHSFTADADRP